MLSRVLAVAAGAVLGVVIYYGGTVAHWAWQVRREA